MLPQLHNIITQYSTTLKLVNREYHDTYSYSRERELWSKYTNNCYKVYNYRLWHNGRGVMNNTGNWICPLPKAYTIP